MGCRGAIVVTAAGGGHTGRAYALAQALAGLVDGDMLYFVVARGDAWSRRKLEGFGRVVEVRRVRAVNESLLRGLLRLPGGLLDAWRSVPRGVCAFVSMGASISVPSGLAARLRGARLYNVEAVVRFTRPSLAARALRPVSHVTVLHWEEQLRIHPGGRVYGPIYPRPSREPRDEGYILVTGGSYGYPELFEAVSRLDPGRVVLHTGRVDPRVYRERHPGWVVFRFDPDFDRWLAGARVVVTHYGNTAVEAALTYGKPLVIVYNPAWRTAAGYRDAEVLAGKLNAVLLPGPPTPEELAEALREAERRRPPRYPNGAERLAAEIAGLCGC
ncbi:MAG: polysaccharide biosynthesis protein [Desulfurococcales archaeon]|nr:polysaccharide biosynthesis protein [Desulfurococcales archaeon]